MSGTFDVAVTGVGLVTSAGVGVQASWERILRGESTATTDPGLAGLGLPVDFSCRVPDFNAAELLDRRTAWRQERFTHLALYAAREAVADAKLDPATWDGARVSVIMGNALGGTPTYEAQLAALREDGVSAVTPMLIPMIGQGGSTGFVSMDCGARGPSWSVSSACASGVTALGAARDLLQKGICDVVIAGGSESALSPLITAGFARMGAMSTRCDDPAAASRPFDVDRDGFVASEGAGVLVLERLDDALARGAHVRAKLSGYGSTSDAFHVSAPRPDGSGAEAAIRMALADAGVGTDEVDHVNAHGTSTPLNDLNEAKVVRRIFGERPVVTSVKGSVGHSLGGAGAIEAVCTVLSVEQGLVPATANLVNQDPQIELDIVTGAPRRMPVNVAINNSFGFGGANAVVVFTK